MLQSLSYAFDFGLWEILTAVVSGAALHIPPVAETGDAEAFARRALAEGIDTVHATPSFFRAVAETGARLEALRVLHLGGEALSRTAVERLAAAVGAGCTLYNGYGPTEVTVNSLLFEIGRPGDLRGGERMPIGYPSAENAVYVVDRWGGAVPVGIPGELWLGGPGVARGYLGRPELTAEKFVPDGFGAEPGGRLYRTGDLVRWRADGTVEFLGRVDHQVKIRGFRIEPGEIEAVLRQHRQVREAVVVPRERPGGAILVAYVAADEAGPGAGELRDFLRGRLPAALVPSAFVRLAELPLTPTGKVDRRSLPEPDLDAGEEREEPRTPAERTLAGIFEEVLGISGVGRTDSFFHLGGHSLLATRVMSRVRQGPGGGSAVAGPLRGAHRGGPGGAARRDRWRRPARRPRRAGDAGRRAAAVVRPGAALVPRAAPARHSGLQHPPAGAPAGAPERRRPRRGAARDRPPPPGAARHLRRAGGAARAVGLAGDGHPLPRGGPLGAAGGAPRAGARAAGRPGGPAPLRPRARPRRPRPAVPARSAGPRGDPHPPPHRRGRLVDGGPRPRAARPLPGGDRRATLAAPRAAQPVLRFRPLAARLAPGGDPGGAARLLAAGAHRPAGGPGPPHGPAAPAGAELRRPRLPLRLRQGGVARPQRLRPRDADDPVHDPARRPRRPARPLQPAGGPRGRLADRGPQPQRARGADRLLRQHSRPARPGPGGAHLPRPDGPGAQGDARRLRAPGPPLRADRRGAAARAQPRPFAALPGLPGVAEQRDADRQPPRPDLRIAGDRRRHRQVRPHPRPARGGGAARGHGGVRRRPVRRADGAAARRAPGDPAGGRPRGAGDPARGAAAAHRRREPPDPRAERRRRAASARRGSPRSPPRRGELPGLPGGRPRSAPEGFRLYLLDPALRPTPLGVPGEVYVGGPGLAWASVDRPERAAARLVPDPFATSPGARLYRTGELARYRGNGGTGDGADGRRRFPRPSRPPVAGGARGRAAEAVRGAAHAGRESARGHLAGDAGGQPGGPGGRLLRSRRPLAAGHPGRRAGCAPIWAPTSPCGRCSRRRPSRSSPGWSRRREGRSSRRRRPLPTA